MATLNQNRRYNFLFSLLIFYFLTLITKPISSFSLQGFNGHQNPNFDSDFTLLGDAQIANEGNFVNLTSPTSGFTSSGQIVYKKPFKLVDSKSSKPIISFSTEFTFTITPGNGDGLAFVIFPSGGELSQVFDQGYFGVSDKIDRKFVAVEYDTRKDDNVGDFNGNHVGVNVGSSFVSKDISDVSSIGLLLNGGIPLNSWIDYEASSKRLEIRLAESGSEKPVQPLMSFSIDLSKMWGDKEVLVGISSSSGNSTQVSSLSSWSFRVRTVPSSLHSQPLDPQAHSDEERPIRRNKSRFLTVLGALIFATGCGTLVAFVALFFWVVLFGRHSNVVPEMPMNQVDFKYEKVNVTVDNDSHDTTS
ncbi:probable L-type lectin-domain containing receptor kinase S.7 [Chenopodium quinoa]|uniref:probable L-type lectin-domain containing receptor kinase S.7 n=1 Tax=Chenopodium quinoa TaxID=63459 RepID=UPI000B7955C7|nr:probable L-type lectin-domain containing receptor kinase S.7 [Chenopodium quinoa]